MIETIKIENIADFLEEIKEVKLKAEDVREVEASTGKSPSLGLLTAIVSSDEAWCIRVNGQIGGWWGCMKVSETVAAPWFLSTDIVWEMPTVLLRHAMKFVNGLPYKTLVVSVWTGNKEAYKLLNILGFKPTPFIFRYHCPDTPFQCLVKE